MNMRIVTSTHPDCDMTANAPQAQMTLRSRAEAELAREILTNPRKSFQIIIVPIFQTCSHFEMRSNIRNLPADLGGHSARGPFPADSVPVAVLQIL